MNRWLLTFIALAIAGVAFFALGRGGPGSMVAPLDDIDEASRERLEGVLRDAERGR